MEMVLRRCIRSLTIVVMSACILMGSLLIAPVARGDEASDADARREARREWLSLANGRTDFEVSDPALLPKQLALAAEQSGCKYKDDIKEAPVRFIKVKERYLAVVFCRLSVTGSHQAFDLSDASRPKLLEFPYVAEQGFGTTDSPGLITWIQEAGLFQAESGSDLCPSQHIRHVYRPGVTNRASLVVVRVEVSTPSCGGGPREWTTIWEAASWPVPVGDR